jgi:pimeloyl-ACP methyl ester carboxylesterase
LLNMALDFDFRKYGAPPFKAAVLHGGPGAPGYMAPVARELSKTTGVFEPLQTKDSLEGQINELEQQLTRHTDPPATLISSSWGALLALFLAAKYKNLSSKLILIGCAVFDTESSAKITPRRLSRLSEPDRRRYNEIMRELDNAPPQRRNALMKEWGNLLDTTDMYDPITTETETLEVQYDLHTKVWSDYVTLRDQPGVLESKFSRIDIPVTVIHGEYDPHPIEGIRPFLENCIKDINFHILPRCGHYPWLEHWAKDEFYNIVKREI